MPAQTANARLTADPTLQWVWLTFSALNTLNAHSKMTSAKEKPLFEIGLVWKHTCKFIWFLFGRPKSGQWNIRHPAGWGLVVLLEGQCTKKCQEAYLGYSHFSPSSFLPRVSWRSWGWRAGRQKDFSLISVFIWGLLNRVFGKKTAFSM